LKWERPAALFSPVFVHGHFDNFDVGGLIRRRVVVKVAPDGGPVRGYALLGAKVSPP
jgi:hypothetical protein